MAGYILGILITVVMPVFLTAVMCMRIKTAKPAILGALCFLASQVFTRLPILQYVLPKSGGVYHFPDEASFVLYADARTFSGCVRRMREMAFYEGRKN